MITAAATGARAHEGFVVALEFYSEKIGAEIIICAIPGVDADAPVPKRLAKHRTISSGAITLCRPR